MRKASVMYTTLTVAAAAGASEIEEHSVVVVEGA